LADSRQQIAEMQAIISRHNQMEEELYNSKQMLQLVLDNIPLRVFWKDRNSVYIGCNKPLAQDCGYTDPTELIGKTDYETASVETADLYRADDQKVMESGVAKLNFEEPQIKPDGSHAWLNTSKVPLRDKNGHVMGVLGMYEDITKRKQAEEALQASESKYRDLIQKIHAAIVVHGAETQIQTCNQQSQELLGLTEEQMLGRQAIDPDWHFFREDGTVMPLEEYPVNRVLASKKPFRNSIMGVHRSADDVDIWVLVSASPVFDEKNEVAQIIVTFVDITERKRAEEELIKQTTLFRGLFDSSPEAIAIVDNEDRVMEINHSFETLFEYSHLETRGRYINELIAPEPYLEDAQFVSQAVVGGGSTVEKEAIRCTKGKCPVHVSLIGSPIVVNDRRIGAFAIYRDITEHKRVEEAVNEKNQFIASLLRAIPVAVFYKDREGRYLGCNDMFTEVMGMTTEQLRGKTVYELWPSEFADKYHSMDLELMHNREHQVYEFQVKAKDGRIHPVIYAKDVFLDKDGGVAGLVGAFLDITDQKQAEAALRLDEERLEVLLALNNMTDASESELTHFAMEAAVRLTNSTIGYVAFMNEDETVLEMQAWSKKAMDDCAVMDKPVAYPVATTGLWGEAVRQRRMVITNDYAASSPWKKGTPDGHVHITRHMNAPTLDGDRIVIVAGVGNKLTDYGNDDVRQISLLMSGLWAIIRRKRAEEEKYKLETQLIQAQKMESIGRLAGGVAHDYNNMLSAILGHVELAKEKLSPSDPIYNDLEVIEKAANRSAALTRQLLAFARRQTVEPRLLDLNDVVAGMLKMLHRLIGEDIDFAWMPGAALWQVKVDQSQIDQILANLCVNARDAIDGIGKITIETENVVMDESYCPVPPGTHCGQYVMLAVSDDGRGMDKEILGQIFEPFFTTKDIGKGTGLGLATVYGIVKQNDGFINVYSEPGKGTTFKIYLPRAQGTEAESMVKDIAETAIGGKETVLLVEDEQVLLNLGTVMLERLGYSVLAAGTPREALTIAKMHVGEIQLIITDVIMPEMNGRDLVQAIIAVKPGIKCLYISGYTANVIVHRGILDHGVHFLQKPFSMKDLAEKVRRALDRG